MDLSRAGGQYRDPSRRFVLHAAFLRAAAILSLCRWLRDTIRYFARSRRFASCWPRAASEARGEENEIYRAERVLFFCTWPPCSERISVTALLRHYSRRRTVRLPLRSSCACTTRVRCVRVAVSFFPYVCVCVCVLVYAHTRR